MPAGFVRTATVTALDQFGNVDLNYLGKSQLTSSDTAAQVPSTYAFTASDKGTRAFNVTFNTVEGKAWSSRTRSTVR